MARFLSHTEIIKSENSYLFITNRSVRLYNLRHKKFLKIALFKNKSTQKISCYHQRLSCGKPQYVFLMFYPPPKKGKCNLIWLTPPKSPATLYKVAVFRYENRPHIQ